MAFDLDAYLMSNGKARSHSDVGGYPIWYLCRDGGVLCPACVTENIKEIRAALADSGTDMQWEINAADANWENPDLICDHCNKRIESAYVEDKA